MVRTLGAAWAAGVLLGSLAGCVQPQEPISAEEAKANPSRYVTIKGETTRTPLPSGFQRTYYSDSTGRDTSRVLEGQSLSGPWTELINTKTERRSNPPSPVQHVEAVAQTRPRGCTNRVVEPVIQSTVNGYPAATVKMTCTAINGDTSRTETVLIRAIKGDEGIYSAQYVVRFPPDEQKLAKMQRFIDGFKVCNSLSADHPSE
jgi:hypothetical protein